MKISHVSKYISFKIIYVLTHISNNLKPKCILQVLYKFILQCLRLFEVKGKLKTNNRLRTYYKSELKKIITETDHTIIYRNEVFENHCENMMTEPRKYFVKLT